MFATDIDSNAIETARIGIFPESIAADVSAERLRRFFTKQGNSYQVTKSIRDTLIFAEQNVIKDPPFSRLDLISCRNLMIYLEPQLQKRLLPLFHYSLRNDGYLFLGSSESISEAIDLFSVIDRKWKIFHSKGAALFQHRWYANWPNPHFHWISAVPGKPLKSSLPAAPALGN